MVSPPLAVCYGADGKIAPGNFPCDPAANATYASACCGTGSVCVNQLYCITDVKATVPGTCTDPEWGAVNKINPRCPCIPRKQSDADDPNLSYRTGVTLCSDGTFCCGAANTDCCAAGKGSHIIEYRNSHTIPSLSGLEFYYTDTNPTTIPPIRSSSASVITSSSASMSFSTLASSPLTPPTPTHSANSQPPSSQSAGLSPGAKAGISIGVIVAVAAVAAAAIFLVLRSRKRRSPAETDNQIVSQPVSQPLNQIVNQPGSQPVGQPMNLQEIQPVGQQESRPSRRSDKNPPPYVSLDRSQEVGNSYSP